MNDEAGSISELVGRGWGEHDREPEAVLTRVEEAVSRAEAPGDVMQLAALGTHVAGEHLFDWARGRALAERLRAGVDAGTDVEKALWRITAAMELGAGGDWEPLFARGVHGNEASCRIRVLALAVQGLAAQGAMDRAAPLLAELEQLAAYGPERDDPAARVLAMAGNNLACALEEKADRTDVDDEMLARAAHMGRRFWEIAGDWTNVKIAEYRLAMTYLALGKHDEATLHANEALRIWKENDGGPDDAFFCHEALAKTALARGAIDDARASRNQAAACLAAVDDEDTKAWFGDALEKLDALLAS